MEKLCGSFFFSSRRRHTRLQGDWSSDVCSSDLTGTRLDRVTYDLGAERYLRTGEILPDAVFDELRAADAIYLGAVGDPRAKNPQYAAGLLLRLRFELDLWVNL